MKLTPRELIYFVELWSTLGLPPRRAAEMLEARATRKQRKRKRKRRSQHGNVHGRDDR